LSKDLEDLDEGVAIIKFVKESQQKGGRKRNVRMDFDALIESKL
jgi:N-acyl-D-aspartate/D-glutamate deacylase